jgi:tRNA-specific 2-thiouridylase
VKAVGLLSGGLDSTVAIKMMLEQGIDVIAFNVVTAFCCCTPKDASCSAARGAVAQLGIRLKVVNATDDFLKIIEDPKHGYGSGMNPCLDCRVMMYKKAREFMEANGASFLVTGDVLGQRPMSQRRAAMMLIDEEAGVRGLVVRPLCAGALDPTIPETEGWIDREKLLAVTGRSRKPQMELAGDMGIKDYPCPAGGCLLTDPIFAERMRDLLRHDGVLRREDVRLLKLGRHFRVSSQVKVVVGRDREENLRLGNELSDGDYALEISGQPGPLTLVRGQVTDGEIRHAAMITSRYGKSGGRVPTTVVCRQVGEGSSAKLHVDAVDRGWVRSMMIGVYDIPPDRNDGAEAGSADEQLKT